ncbi:hypothetical protein GBAR_LOCUS14766, partial [Geodia barretti]
GRWSSCQHTNTIRSVQQVLVELKEEKEKVDEVCMRRHRRWSLSLQLDRLHKDTEKVFVHSPDSTPVALPTVVVTCMTI